MSQFKYEEHDGYETNFKKVPWIPGWFPDGPYAGFIPEFQNGWRGPLTSYWARVHCRNEWFAAS